MEKQFSMSLEDLKNGNLAGVQECTPAINKVNTKNTPITTPPANAGVSPSPEVTQPVIKNEPLEWSELGSVDAPAEDDNIEDVTCQDQLSWQELSSDPVPRPSDEDIQDDPDWAWKYGE